MELSNTVESKIYNIVEQLPEVKTYIHNVDSASGGKIHPQLIIAQKPTKNEPFYWVQVGTTNNGRFVPDYNFMVNESANHEVSFFDTANDTIISLSKWRKSK